MIGAGLLEGVARPPLRKIVARRSSRSRTGLPSRSNTSRNGSQPSPCHLARAGSRTRASSPAGRRRRAAARSCWSRRARGAASARSAPRRPPTRSSAGRSRRRRRRDRRAPTRSVWRWSPRSPTATTNTAARTGIAVMRRVGDAHDQRTSSAREAHTDAAVDQARRSGGRRQEQHVVLLVEQVLHAEEHVEVAAESRDALKSSTPYGGRPGSVSPGLVRMFRSSSNWRPKNMPVSADGRRSAGSSTTR